MALKYRKEEHYISCFDDQTGRYLRTGILKDGRDTGEDPFMTNFPELLDVGIMGHCIHGSSGLCVKAGVECYQDGLHADVPNMAVDDFRRIALECRGRTYQIALGGCGDPDQHEDFEEILRICRRCGIVPNFTTSGLGLSEELAEVCSRYCGAVAVSWYRSEYTLQAIERLVRHGVKTNIHYVLSKSTVEEAVKRLQSCRKGAPESGFAPGINAVVFLLHKPVGLGSKEEMITPGNGKFRELLHLIEEQEYPFRIGFDSCSVPALLSVPGIDPDCLDTCEGARWSAYISADMKMMPCSFDNQKERWAADLHGSTIRQAWNSPEFEDFREHLRTGCPRCDKRTLCMGGCPIVPEIVLCEDKITFARGKEDEK